MEAEWILSLLMRFIFAFCLVEKSDKFRAWMWRFSVSATEIWLLLSLSLFCSLTFRLSWWYQMFRKLTPQAHQKRITHVPKVISDCSSLRFKDLKELFSGTRRDYDESQIPWHFKALKIRWVRKKALDSSSSRVLSRSLSLFFRIPEIRP